MSIHVASDPERAGRMAWRAAFDTQLTRETMNKVRRYAKKRAGLLVRAGVLEQRRGPRELMHEAIVATLGGEATWDPSTVTLDDHLIGVIRWKTRNTERRRAKYNERSLNDSGEDTSSDGHRLENDVTLRDLPASTERLAGMRAAAERVTAEIWPLAQGDTDVLRLLAAIEAGAGNGDLIHASGLRPAKYRNARRRLTRITERLSDETRAAVSAVLV
jgi:hypothetical protein